MSRFFGKITLVFVKRNGTEICYVRETSCTGEYRFIVQRTCVFWFVHEVAGALDLDLFYLVSVRVSTGRFILFRKLADEQFCVSGIGVVLFLVWIAASGCGFVKVLFGPVFLPAGGTSADHAYLLGAWRTGVIMANPCLF